MVINEPIISAKEQNEIKLYFEKLDKEKRKSIGGVTTVMNEMFNDIFDDIELYNETYNINNLDKDDVIDISGEVLGVRFRNEENGWTVFSVFTENHNSYDITGVAPKIEEGDFVRVVGKIVFDKKYGEQIKAESVTMVLPTSAKDMEKYLVKNITGIGTIIARRLLKEFGNQVFQVMANEPEKLFNVHGISKRKAIKMHEEFNKLNLSRDVQMFFISIGVTDKQGLYIIEKLGENFKEKIYENPYQLIELVDGFGFKKADEVAKKIGVPHDSPYRIKAGILYVIENICYQKGHIYIERQNLLQEAAELLQVSAEQVDYQIDYLIFTCNLINEKVVGDDIVNGKIEVIYLSSLYKSEIRCADILSRMLKSNDNVLSKEDIKQRVISIEEKNNKELDESQRNAVIESIINNVMIITGGPGVGKTTTLDIIIKYIKEYISEKDILLLAPTGRAAKRMSEQTGMDAQTIHRFICSAEYFLEDISDTDDFDDTDDNYNIGIPEIIIVDEMSMVDVNLMASLLEVIDGYTTKLIMVGDVDQIPSVGPGLVLKDLINSDVIPVAKLTKIHRQSENNMIIVNAHKINNKEYVELNNKNQDFFFLNRDNNNSVIQTLLNLYINIYPKQYNIKPTDIQVLCPMKKGVLGVNNINQLLQGAINPQDGTKNEINRKDFVFREGDKVMHIKNNYKMEWVKKSDKNGDEVEGIGVFNGEVGYIKEISKYGKDDIMYVEFDDGKLAEYEKEDFSQLMLAYCITIHKSQGGEYPVVLMPLLNIGSQMLFNKNLLYTAVTRASQSVCMLGDEKVPRFMMHNEMAEKRNTGLKDKLITAMSN